MELKPKEELIENKENPNFSRRSFIRASAVTGIGITFNLTSCKKDNIEKPKEDDNDNDSDNDNNIVITSISIPAQIDIGKGSDFEIGGKGFEKNDKIILEALNSNSDYKAEIPLKSFDENGIIITLPNDLSSDRYRVIVKRGDKTRVLGATTLNFVFNANIPDKEGMTVKGVVYSQDKGMEGIVVSDGFHVTKTDKDGIYYLPSEKKGKYVFVSFPGNYEVEVKDSLPQFFQRLTKSVQQVEIKDFELFPVNNNNHTLLALGDMHLANRNNDINQFKDGFIKDIQQKIQELKSSGEKIYALTLGDMSWDSYWYTNNYDLNNYLKDIRQIEIPIFHTMGNHDNDPKIIGDWRAEDKYRAAIGPTYYSFNLGKIHYIVLDNTQYLNDNDRNYNARIVKDQMDWLKKDLEHVDKSTPIIVAMHIQLHNKPSLNGQSPVSSYRLNEPDDFINAFNGFENVQLLTAHTHTNYNVQTTANILEHNIGAVCATWWWTGRPGYANNHICKDGSPGGYDIWKIRDKDMEWRYKGIGFDENYQFRTYDMNKVHITKSKFTPNFNSNTINWDEFIPDYRDENNNNEVLINVWNWDEEWSIEVTENGQTLPTTRVNQHDPLHLVSYNAQRLNVNATPTSSFTTHKTAHIFKVTASSESSTLQIKVTDRFGNIYEESMVRPKEFSTTII